MHEDHQNSDLNGVEHVGQRQRAYHQKIVQQQQLVVLHTNIHNIAVVGVVLFVGVAHRLPTVIWVGQYGGDVKCQLSSPVCHDTSGGHVGWIVAEAPAQIPEEVLL